MYFEENGLFAIIAGMGMLGILTLLVESIDAPYCFTCCYSAVNPKSAVIHVMDNTIQSIM